MRVKSEVIKRVQGVGAIMSEESEGDHEGVGSESDSGNE